MALDLKEQAAAMTEQFQLFTFWCFCLPFILSIIHSTAVLSDASSGLAPVPGTEGIKGTTTLEAQVSRRATHWSVSFQVGKRLARGHGTH